MTWPCCYPQPFYRSCANVDSIFHCESILEGILGPEGTRCSQITEGCWACQNFDLEPVEGWCFESLADGSKRFIETWASNCTNCNSYAPCFRADSPLDCDEPEIPPSGCREAAEDRAAPDGKQWTVDLLGTVGLGLDEIIRADGYVRMLSSELVRARAESVSVADPCGHIASELVVLSDGYVYNEVCSQPTWDKPESRRRSHAILRTAKDTPSMQDGYQYAVASIQLPSWTEVVYRSHKILCEEQPQ